MKRNDKAMAPGTWQVPGYVLVRAEAGQRHVSPRSEQATICVMLAGASADVSVDDGDLLPRTYRAGDICFIPRSSTLSFGSAGLPARLLILIDHRKEAEILEDMFGDAPGRLCYRANVVTRDIQHLRKLLVQFVDRPGSRGMIYLESLLVMLTCEVFSEAWRADARSNDRRQRLPPPVLRRVLDYIEQNLHANITLAALAEVAGLSRYHFNRCFRGEMGRPPYQFVLSRRLDVARHLLETSDRSITDIASSTGFTSQANLTTAFRRAYGVTPLAFRKNS
jgi:AraC family transcriptional regulator